MQLRLSKCLLTYVDAANGPKWGQLGCNGFIVLDSTGKVAHRQTSAYLEVKELAFAHVESLLESLFEDAAPPPLASPLRAAGEQAYEANYETAEKFDRVTGGCVQPKAGGGEEEMPERMKRAAAKKAAGPAKAAKADPPAKVADVAPLAAIDSVHVAALDAEHDACAAALAAMAEAPSRENIEKVIEAYSAHFAHEEKLLDQHLYADARQATGFSADKGARTSHFGDHEAMLGALRKLVAARAGLNESLASISVAEVQQIAVDFERHATSYDGSYADRLSAAMAAAA